MRAIAFVVSVIGMVALLEVGNWEASPSGVVVIVCFTLSGLLLGWSKP